MERFDKGDLVQIIRPTVCCVSEEQMGKIGVIEDVRPNAVWFCQQRGLFTGAPCAIIDGYGIELSRLKKLDAPLEDETIDTAKEVTA